MEKIALITGSKGGIGSAITSQLVKDGYRVIATHSTGKRECAQKWFEVNKFTSDQVRLFELDVTDTQQCAERLRQLLEDEGTVDVVINNAGITKDGVFKKMTAQSWKDVIDTNLNSVFNVTQPLFAPMCEKGGGRVINISSVNGIKGQFGQTNYSAAKAGMIGFTKALAAEGARSGVTVNAVAPGYTMTPMVEMMKPETLDFIKGQIPMGRLAASDEIAKAVSFLISDAGAYITGETLSVNGGLHMQ
ncbi:SDR family oxidoreductase [Vibrio panuliri]|uniref:Beta-ketoacyl-ACP reductase n=1 Tax=Vibrio panuliri TaxID=1381081 RepID=A0A1Q9HA17_9VIBR|nr:SDR family oxidoreductase [Vibrio panuliri]KAB1457476.1 SDR family oxidoreductase [Vibrio panuliri]OLQ85922.1 beta-ketoacyl-ACP reductase [Vibrio panuliri]OLQ91362.1 beta-ketoacyl-ACP reductase [Vibrio panuliri]